MKRPKKFRYVRRAPWEREWKPRGPLVPGRSLNPRVQKELRRANHLMAIGQHHNAAVVFMDIAGRALDRGIVYPAPMLYLQAAHAYLMGEEYEKSGEAATTGLELLAGQERRERLREQGSRYVDVLEQAGRKEEAQHYRAWLADRLGGEAPETSPEAMLPEKCPYCGATMSMDELRSRRGQVAECRYCGSVVTARKGD